MRTQAVRFFFPKVGSMTESSAFFRYKISMRHKHTWGENGSCACGAQRCTVAVLNNAKEHRIGQCTGGARPGHSYCKKHLYIERFRSKPLKTPFDYSNAA